MNITDQIGPIMLQALINSLWQGLLVVAVAICILFIVRNLNAATRYLIFWLILIILAFMPLLNIIITTVRIFDLPQETVNNASYQINESDYNNSLSFFRPINITVPLKILPSLILGLWISAVVFLLSRLLRSYLYTSKLKKILRLSPEYRQKFGEFLKPDSIRRKVAIYSTSKVKMPMAIGLFGPVILIPESLMDKLTDEQLRQVILHELAHIMRWDDWTNLAQKIIETFFFWNPVVLYISRRLNLEREIACDDWVITLFGESKSYALCLTKLIEFNVPASSQIIATGVALHRKHIATRIRMLLDKSRNTAPSFSRYNILMTICTIALGFLVSIRISPVLALVVKDKPETVSQIENIIVKEPLAKQETKSAFQSKIQQEDDQENNEAVVFQMLDKVEKRKDNNYRQDPKLAKKPTVKTNRTYQNKPQTSVKVVEKKAITKDDIVKTQPPEIAISTEKEKPATSVLERARYEEPKKAPIETYTDPIKVEEPATFTAVADDDNVPDAIRKLNDKAKEAGSEVKKTLISFNESTQNAIDTVANIGSDKSEKIQNSLAGSIGGFGGSLKDSARKLGEKANSSSKVNAIKSGLGRIFRRSQ